MAKRSGNNSIPFWGPFPTAADLVNVAGATKQTGALDVGDQSFTTTDDTYWLCTDATLGAAVWIPIAAASSVIIYRPGGTPNSRVVTTFPALKAAVAAFDGPVTIYFDDSIVSPIVLPTGVWTITNPHMVWRGLGDYIAPVVLHLANGFVCQTTGGQCALGATYGDVEITGLSATTPPFPITATSTIECYGSALGGSAVLAGNAAAGCLFEVNAVQLGVDLYGVELGNYVFSLVSGAQLFLSAFDGSEATSKLWLNDDGSSTFQIVKTDGSAQLTQVQTGFTGSATWDNFLNYYIGGVRETRHDITHATGPFGLGSERVITVDTSTGTISTLTLPDGSTDLANGWFAGVSQVFWVEDVGGIAATNPITVDAPFGGTINGLASFVLSINYAKIKITTDDGLNYFVTQMTTLDPNLVKARTVTGGADTLTVKDFLVEYSNAGAVAVSLPALGAPPAGTWWVLFLQQTNAATIVTVTPATSIDGAGTLVFPTGIYSASLRSKDGSVWYSR